jgi:cell wall-associated NlpC family hydrolase
VTSSRTLRRLARGRLLAGCALLVGALVLAPDGVATAARKHAAPTAGALEVLAERYNGALVRLQAAQSKVDETSAAVGAAQRRVSDLTALLRARVAGIYTASAEPPGVFAVLGSRDPTQLERSIEYQHFAAEPNVTLLRTATSARDALRARADAASDAIAELQNQADTAHAAYRKLLRQAASAAAAGWPSNGDGAGPVGTPHAKHGRAGTTQAAAAAVQPSTRPVLPATTVPRPSLQQPPPTTRPAPPPTLPRAPSRPSPPPANVSKASIAVAFARRQLGKPYRFAAAGPNAYDCSGLTMAAWAAAGVSMPHYSVSQAQMFPRVSWSQLQPGDIVVFYSDYHHVGLYIGGGMMIHAPQTGDVVRIAPAWRTTFQFGVRP